MPDPDVLDIVGDKWWLLVVRQLDQGPRRFTELKREIDGISQRMPTVTLRSLERRHPDKDRAQRDATARQLRAHPDGPLTSGRHNPLLKWSIGHLAEIDVARARYDTADAPTTPWTTPRVPGREDAGSET